MEHFLEVVDHSQQGPIEDDSAVRRISLQVADHNEAQFGMAFHQIRECLGASVRAEDEHVADVAPVVARQDENLPDEDPDSNRGDDEGWECDYQDQPANVGQLEDVQQAKGQGQLNQGCAKHRRDVAAPGPADSTAVEAVHPQHSDPHGNEYRDRKVRVRQRLDHVGRPAYGLSKSEVGGSHHDCQRKQGVGGYESQAQRRGVAADHISSPFLLGTLVHPGPRSTSIALSARVRNRRLIAWCATFHRIWTRSRRVRGVAGVRHHWPPCFHSCGPAWDSCTPASAVWRRS